MPPTVSGDTGFFTHGEGGAWNVLSCYVDVVLVTFHYNNGSFNTLEKTQTTDLNMTRRIAVYAGTDYIVHDLPSAIEGTGLVAGNYTTAFALELSRRLIGLTGSIYEPGNTIKMQALVPGLGARLSLAPLVFLIIDLITYWLRFSIGTISFLGLIVEHQSGSSGHHRVSRN